MSQDTTITTDTKSEVRCQKFVTMKSLYFTIEKDVRSPLEGFGILRYGKLIVEGRRLLF